MVARVLVLMSVLLLVVQTDYTRFWIETGNGLKFTKRLLVEALRPTVAGKGDASSMTRGAAHTVSKAGSSAEGGAASSHAPCPGAIEDSWESFTGADVVKPDHWAWQQRLHAPGCREVRLVVVDTPGKNLLYPMCNSFSGLRNHQAIEVERRTPELEIQKDADGMRQHLTNEAMLKMPEIMDANPRDGKAFGQMRPHRLDPLAQAFARLQQAWAGGRGHAFAGRREHHNAVSLG
jgi:hypothetical protein